MKTSESKSSKSSHSSTPLLTSNKTEPFFANATRKEPTFFGPLFIQPKLEVGRPGDKYEQEADRVADQVMRMPDSQVRRQPKEEEEQLQMKSERIVSTAGQNVVGSDISGRIKSKAGSGRSLPGNVESEMSHKMGADFSDVSIHTDLEAAKLNQQLGARAFTHGPDIYFNEGEYSPESSEGKRLLAHELTHVVQQGNNMFSDRIARQEDDVESEGESFEFPGITRMMTPMESQLHVANLTITQPALAATLQSLLIASATLDITIGVGVQLEAAGVIGGVGSVGYVINNGRLGFYGSYGGDIGAVVGASAEILVTIIDGGLNRFSGTAFAAVFGGGEVVVGHVSILMPTSGGGFLGVAVSGGVGIGLTPIEAYITISNTHSPNE